MNPLTHGLPSTVTIGGREFAINTSHKIGIKFEALIQSAYDDRTKFDAALALYFPEVPPDRIAAMDALSWFYRSGEKPDDSDGRRAYDFAIDHALLHASFMREYNIDLYAADMHWWAFRSLMMGLSEDSPFMKAVGYRLMNIPAKLDRDTRNFYAKMKRLYALPAEGGRKMTPEEVYRAKFGDPLESEVSDLREEAR